MGILDNFFKKKRIKLLSYSSLDINVLKNYIRYNNDLGQRVKVLNEELELLISNAQKKLGPGDVAKIVREEHINNLIVELNEIKTMMQFLEQESTKVTACLQKALK